MFVITFVSLLCFIDGLYKVKRNNRISTDSMGYNLLDVVGTKL